ncbi:hypothetical protein [Ramlibacter alkalitolerans]|uniref:Lipoprotein n=1 Tax=Ramlibacter alkalitolerans TaxID=2039631 RepID=A0ABS1JSX7_9BURK|nr:hypothetical protein [Ramlibacter alkalitolerans]MBL0427349.1 hypothetical protein [Ramlibacter alkalitolerans]
MRGLLAKHRRPGKAASAVAATLALALLAACGSKPRQPDWLVNADGAQDRFERAYLSGRDNVAAKEFQHFRDEVASTAQASLVARAELTRCAVRVASLDFAPCAGFEPLREDAGDAERAYADFLAGRLAPEQAKALPEDYRGIAGEGGAGRLEKIKNPLSRVIAAGVLLRTGKADPQVLEIATRTASDQGWRRAVMAWLGAQAMLAEKNGDREEAARLRRRMEIAAEER